MPEAPSPAAARIDALMEQASTALVARKYFECERVASEALQLAFAAFDYDRMARIVLPLQEARRQKRDLALDSGRVTLINQELPLPGETQPGCYLVTPPRVGLDGRLLREQADREEVPVIVIVREPTTRTGHWPVVVLGPVTIRTRIAPPTDAQLQKPGAAKKRPAKKRSDAASSEGADAATAAPPAPLPSSFVDDLPPGVLPTPEWFVAAGEAIGDAAIADIEPSRAPDALVEDLYLRLQAHPDHEKLHQRLHEACARAAQLGTKPPPRPRPRFGDDDDASDLDE